MLQEFFFLQLISGNHICQCFRKFHRIFFFFFYSVGSKGTLINNRNETGNMWNWGPWGQAVANRHSHLSSIWTVTRAVTSTVRKEGEFRSHCLVCCTPSQTASHLSITGASPLPKSIWNVNLIVGVSLWGSCNVNCKSWTVF